MYAWLTLSHESVTLEDVETRWTAEQAKMLGIALQKHRQAAGLSQEIAAYRAGISRNHYQLLEHGLSDRAKQTPANPRINTLVDLAHVFGVKLRDVIGDLE